MGDYHPPAPGAKELFYCGTLILFYIKTIRGSYVKLEFNNSPKVSFDEAVKIGRYFLSAFVLATFICGSFSARSGKSGVEVF